MKFVRGKERVLQPNVTLHVEDWLNEYNISVDKTNIFFFNAISTVSLIIQFTVNAIDDKNLE